MGSDDGQHFVLGLMVTIVFGWQVGTAVNITLEATQANYYATNGGSYSSWDWADTAQDLIVTEAGVAVGEVIHRKLKKKEEVRIEKDHCVESPHFPGIFWCGGTDEDDSSAGSPD